MANYRESSATALKHRRAYSVEISNPQPPEAPRLVFREQDVLSIDGEASSVEAGALMASFNPARTIDLLDPETLEPTGQTTTEGAVYLALFSKYIATARKRDAYVDACKATAAPGAPIPIYVEPQE